MKKIKEQYLKELNKAFGDFKFYEDGHYYTYKDKPIEIGVTGLIAQYENEFDSQTIAERVAIKNQQIVDRISKDRWATEEDIELKLKILTDKTNTIQGNLNLWDYKNAFARHKGTNGHNFAQSLWSDKEYQLILFDLSESFKTANKSIFKQAKQFYNDFKDKLVHLEDEFVIGSYEYDIASAIDHLFINKMTGELVLVDYKTNSDIHKNERYTKKMKVPLSHLKDTTLNHYAIQLSFYKYLIEKYTSLKVSEFFIVWFSELNENYEIIEVPYLKNEVIKMLENRRVRNMKSVPVLVIGKSGTGKSASLRNFKEGEVAIANVLGKPLPFKSKLDAPKVDDYNVLMQAIEKTDKKIIVVDDAGYLITKDFMDKISVKGYDKYNEMGGNYFDLINKTKDVEGGKTIYFFMHEDIDEFGNVKPKTIGRLLDEKVNLQGMFTVCIRSMYKDGKYIFRVKTNGQDCVKTPIGMFDEDEIENDLKLVDEKIREYYDLDKKEEIKK